MKKLRLSIILFILILFGNIAYAQTISQIKIEGNERVEISTIKSYLALKEGDTYSSEKIDNSIKNLFATELFYSVNIDLNGSILVIKIVENPKINKVIFEGNKKIKDEDLMKEISLIPRTLYTKSKLQTDINRILDLYIQQGLYSVKIDPKLVNLQQNRIDLIFEIKEGSKATVKKIIFEGNKKFSDGKLLSVIHSAESQWYSFFTNNDQYSQYKTDYDKELLSRFYKSKGYAAFQVLSVVADLNDNKDKFFLTFTIEEGDKYNYGEINVECAFKKIDLDTIKKILRTQKGKVYNQEEIVKTLEKVTEYINGQGYPFVNIEPIQVLNEDTKTVDLTYQIEQGRKSYLGQINIHGNVRTSDKVIRREFKIFEGDPYNPNKISASEKNLNELDFFEKVEIKQVQGKEADKFDLDVNVEEKSTAGINFAGGYNTVNGPMGAIILSDKNLFGKGNYLSFGVTKSKRKIDFNISYTDPYFIDLPLAAGFDLGKDTTKSDNSQNRPFNSKSKFFALRGGYEVKEDISHNIRYSISKSSVYNVSSSASDFIKDQEGNYTTSAISNKLTYDTRDSLLDPTSGLISSIEQQFAGIGGNTKYLKHELATGYYVPIYGEEVILELSGFAGHIKGLGKTKNVKINNEFFLGGDNLRGFNYAGIGPRAKVLTNGTYSDTNYKGDSLGGDYYYLGQVEVKVPINIQKELGLFGTVFVDAGEVFKPSIANLVPGQYFNERGIRAAYGVGFGFKTPMGPIKISYAIPFKKKRFDQIDRFEVSFTASKF